MYARILVLLEREFGIGAAWPIAAELARAGRGAIRLLHLTPEPAAAAVGGRVVAYADQEAERLRHEAEDARRTAAQALPGLPVDVRVRFGDAAEQILAEAGDFGADLIVMATRGRTPLERVLVGSAAEAVLRRSAVPVVLIRPRPAPAA